MSRRKNVDRPTEPSVHKPPTRVPRRKRRKPTGGVKPQATHSSGRTALREELPDERPMHDTRAMPIKTSRAPRPAESPPANPNVFSYTFTIWKSN